MYKEKRSVSFGDIEVRNKGNNRFLKNVKEIINWGKIEKIIKKYDTAGSNRAAPPAYSRILLFKILLLQNWFNLSDYRAEEEINDKISFMKFLDVSIGSDLPDHSTICNFRNFLYSNNIHKKLLNEINKQLSVSGFIVKGGSIVDATIVSSSCRPRKTTTVIAEDRKEEVEQKIEEKFSKDEDARWLKKGNRCYFGYKVHAIVNKDGYIQGGVTTSANESDIIHLKSILDEVDIEKGTAIMCDKGYDSKKKSRITRRKRI